MAKMPAGVTMAVSGLQFDDDSLTYYTYELNAPDALTGPHVLAQASDTSRRSCGTT